MLQKAVRVATTTMCFIIIGAAAGHALAGEMPKYDRKIEAAAMAIVAQKVGDIRGSMEVQWVAEFGVDDTMTGPVGGASASNEPVLKPKPVLLLASLGAPRAMPQRRTRIITSFLYY